MNRKLLISLSCTTLLFGLSACSSHDKTNSDTKTQQEDTKEIKKDEPRKKEPQKELSNKGESANVYIMVSYAESLDVIGNEDVKAQGIFKALEVYVMNRQEEPITLNSKNFKLIDDLGREYYSSTEAQLALKAVNNATFKFDTLNPDSSSLGKIVFDVPKYAKGLVLQFNGDMLDKEIDLKVE
ncbi:hypothetical protein CON70_24070 [Bacillus pseudomycoides]|uniref:DUF4352 domain-containing protein n=1 Tax=Bacillus pseudomycoides TaxID=64104 RepID=UPI000BEDE5F9|nr:DUF4352 domain-containing protein [Bacillus pseudomycoides]PDZ09088.1 hypothetical protein CON70_24070 [Bacillus pseudomycoides]